MEKTKLLKALDQHAWVYSITMGVSLVKKLKIHGALENDFSKDHKFIISRTVKDAENQAPSGFGSTRLVRSSTVVLNLVQNPSTS